MRRDERRRSRRLEVLSRLQSHREREKATALGRLRRHVDEQERRLRSLCEYRSEYRRQTLDAAGQGLPMAHLNRLHRFMGQLDEAIRQQQGLLNRLRDEIAREEQCWREVKARQQGMQRLLDESRQRIRVHEGRMEQRSLDEISGRARPPGVD